MGLARPGQGERSSNRPGTSARAFSPGARARLLAYAWPGNVRELQNAVKYAAALATGASITQDCLPDELLARRPPGRPGPAQPRLASLAEAERAHVLHVLEACGGGMSEAARVLAIGRNTLWRKLRQYE